MRITCRCRRLALAASILGIVFSVSPALLAQTTGQIRGTVTDEHGAGLPGATVEVSSPSLQGMRSTVSGAGGSFQVPALPPGNYLVAVSLTGFAKAEQQTQVRLDATASVTVTLQVSATAQIVVTGEAPVVDVSTTTGGTNYTAGVIDRLPVGRNYTDIVRSNPGVTEDRADRQGRSTALTVYGSTSAENNFIVDGVDTTNVIRGLQGKVINNEFIQEVEVKTDSYRAEYGNATGGIINVITKSGGNTFSGSVFGRYNSASVRADEVFTANDSDTFTGTLTPKDEKWDYGLNLGGFIVKDKLWFFGAYNRITDNQLISPPRGVVAGQTFPLDAEANLWSGKLTWNFAAGGTLVGTAFADPGTQDGAIRTPNSTDPGSYLGHRDIGGIDYGGRANILFGKIGLLTVQGSRHNDQFELTGTDAGNAIQFTDETVPPPFPVSGGLGRINGYQDFNSSHRDQYTADFVAYPSNHEVKVGGAFIQRATEAIDLFTGGQQVAKRIDEDSGTTYYAHTFFGTRLGGGDAVPVDSNDVHLRSNDYSAYVQDSWKALHNLTIDAGLRFDRTDIKGFDGKIVSRLTNEWQPRIGVIWDPSAQGTTKVYGFYGRFYYAIPTDINVRDFGSELFVTTYNFDPISTVHDPNAPGHPRPDQQGGAFNEPIDENIHGMYQDEFTIGVEKALAPTFSVEIKGMYRRLGNAIDDRCDLDYSAPVNLGNSCANINPGGDGLWASGNFPWYDGYSLGGFHDAPAPQSPRAKRLYRAIQLSARKTVGTWLWLQASYVYSSVRGNYDGAVHESTGQTDPGLNEDFDYPATYANAYGRLFLDRPHQFRLDAAYTAPFGLTAGLQFYVRSGVPLDQLRSDWPDYLGSNLYMVPRGSAGRTPTEYEANLSFGYNIVIAPVTLVPQVFIYNLLNRQSETYQNIQYIIAAEGDPNQFNPDYGKVVSRTPPRQFVFGLKAMF
jgi:outer membrane receptor protein involved in Fe transport